MPQLTNLPAPIMGFLSYKMTIQGRSEKTIYNYGIDLCAFFRYLIAQKTGSSQENIDLETQLDNTFLQNVKDGDIYSYLLFCASTLKNKPCARARKLCAIKGFFKYLTVNAKLLSVNPAKDIEAPKIPKNLPRYLTLEESRGFLDTVKQHGKENALRDTAIFTLFLHCGMRLNELCSIRLSDLSPELETVIITGKGSKQRLLYLNQDCRRALRAYIDKRMGMTCREPDALWVSRNHGPLTDKAVQYAMEKYIKLAGLQHKKISVHKLRHTAATLLYSTGKVDVRVLKDILGHEQLNTTQIYTHVSNEQVRSAMMENPLSKPDEK